MSDEPDDGNILTEKQLAALQAARHALVTTIERLIGSDEHQVVQLVFIAVSGLFADMLALSVTLPGATPSSSMRSIRNSRRAAGSWCRPRGATASSHTGGCPQTLPTKRVIRR
jgi:hypothetical protein